MKNLSLIYLCYAGILLGVQPSLSLRCWNCDSSVNSVCLDPFDNSTLSLIDCDGQLKGLPVKDMKDLMCRKINRQKAEGWVINRDCCMLGEPDEGEKEPQKYCASADSEAAMFMAWYACSEDGCNGAPSFPKHSLQIIIFLQGIFFLINSF